MPIIHHLFFFFFFQIDAFLSLPRVTLEEGSRMLGKDSLCVQSSQPTSLGQAVFLTVVTRDLRDFSLQ